MISDIIDIDGACVRRAFLMLYIYQIFTAVIAEEQNILTVVGACLSFHIVDIQSAAKNR